MNKLTFKTKYANVRRSEPGAWRWAQAKTLKSVKTGRSTTAIPIDLPELQPNSNRVTSPTRLIGPEESRHELERKNKKTLFGYYTLEGTLRADTRLYTPNLKLPRKKRQS